MREAGGRREQGIGREGKKGLQRENVEGDGIRRELRGVMRMDQRMGGGRRGQGTGGERKRGVTGLMERVRE